ncbi:MAG TPA: M20/M25/M40 family metallo-hydrolase [Flexivirga sp.]|uniref:M20/M25/M40 family metallo-hydrolase n=1 Tax=Flexivirga sp. TaxID=1962927 RepID=UPI002D1B2472|nr:M20/M25/M40 family metallo-hydrolase [Flexivirga sp.]HWC24157.1 M20/M25/M40 family metallo-hydrolase [Flexivirga sp.]
MTETDARAATPGRAKHDRSEVVRFTRELIRMDTSNHGVGKAEGEEEAADYVRSLLEDVGLSCQVFAPEPRRTTLVSRWQGRQPELPALMLHGHLDVVPAQAADWTRDPFGGELVDGVIWGRGAVDMKGTDAMILATVRSMIRSGRQPARDVVLTFFADEESGSTYGSDWMVKEHPEVFAGVSHAISEVGGYSTQINGRRAYLLQTGEKGVLWLKLTARGTAGHGSQVHHDNAVITLADAIGRIARIPCPVSLGATTTDLLARVRGIAGLPRDADPSAVADATGQAARFVTPSLQNVINVTMFSGGYKENVVPEEASAMLDIRFLPGQREAVLRQIQQRVGPQVTIETRLVSEAVENPFEGELIDQITSSIERHDPGAAVLPYLLPAGTDNKQLGMLGIRGYGFAPLKLPADLDFPALFHGVDERITVDSLVFGQDVLTDLLANY